MGKQFTASVKKYDPDDEDSATFDTWAEAARWLLDQQRYGFHSMRINGGRVHVHAEQIVNDEEPICTNPKYYEVFGTQKERDAFAQTFRPQPTRGSAPTNPDTLRAKGEGL